MNRRKPALAVRLYVDDHDLTHWEIYERASEVVVMRVRTTPQALSRVLKTIREIT